ncbi:MAG: TonB-dependent receptor plug domain-containing protein [Bacteroidales bacterium]|nr:TonB-dependent receptor plug domain-containing protein [Bacteroidales bacterium]
MKKFLFIITMLMASFTMAAQEQNEAEMLFQTRVDEMIKRLKITDEQKSEFVKIYRAYADSIAAILGDEPQIVYQRSKGNGMGYYGNPTGVESFSSNRPGDVNNVLIRGAHSFNSGTEPLYILDGSEIDRESLNTLNKNDIADITILKDAAGTAIYGARGANGVVVITTKKVQAEDSSKPALTKEQMKKIEQERAQNIQKANQVHQFFMAEFAKVLNEKQLERFPNAEEKAQKKNKKKR